MSESLHRTKKIVSSHTSTIQYFHQNSCSTITQNSLTRRRGCVRRVTQETAATADVWSFRIGIELRSGLICPAPRRLVFGTAQLNVSSHTYLIMQISHEPVDPWGTLVDFCAKCELRKSLLGLLAFGPVHTQSNRAEAVCENVTCSQPKYRLMLEGGSNFRGSSVSYVPSFPETSVCHSHHVHDFCVSYVPSFPETSVCHSHHFHDFSVSYVPSWPQNSVFHVP